MKAKPLVPWVGSKTRMAKHIIPLLPEHRCYVEVFCGAAGVFFKKDESPVEVINDINGDLINMYRVVRYHPAELFRQFEWTLNSREEWDRLRSIPAASLTDVQRAARFIFIQKLAWGGNAAGQTFSARTERKGHFDRAAVERNLKLVSVRLSRTIIERLPWERCMKKYDRPHTLFYCDPPYYQTGEDYGVSFSLSDYDQLATMMRKIKGDMIVSMNDHPDMRDVFAGLKMIEVDCTYSKVAPGAGFEAATRFQVTEAACHPFYLH